MTSSADSTRPALSDWEARSSQLVFRGDTRAAAISVDSDTPANLNAARDGPHRRAARHAVSPGGMDGATGRASCRRLAHECVCAHAPRADGRQPAGEAVRRSEMGGASGREDIADRRLARDYRGAACALGVPAEDALPPEQLSRTMFHPEHGTLRSTGCSRFMPGTGRITPRM